MAGPEIYQKCLDQGLTAKDAAREAGVVVQVVYAWARRQGVRFNSPRAERVRIYKQCLEEGLNAKATAVRAGVCVDAALKWAKYNGLRFNLVSEMRDAVLMKLAARGLTVADAAELIGMPREYVYKWSLKRRVNFRYDNRWRARFLRGEKREDYQTFRAAGYTTNEAVNAVLQGDLKNHRRPAGVLPRETMRGAA